jgi:hypothetical protein
VPASREEIAEQLVDREAIRDCLYRYCRGCDRVDVELIATSLWPDATSEYRLFSCASAQETIDKVVSSLKGMEMAKHMITNFSIEIRGDVASCESYVFGSSRQSKPDGTRFEKLTSGRYVDRFERRGGEWRIAKRLVITDWAQELPATDSGDGARWPDDRSYAFLAL